jgi:hypothetical protein
MKKSNEEKANLESSVGQLVQYFNKASLTNPSEGSLNLNKSNESAFDQIDSEFRYWAGASFEAVEQSKINTLPTSCSPREFWSILKRRMERTDLVVDLGSGVRPNLFLGQKVTICVELFKPYLEYLRKIYPGESIVTVEEDVLSFLKRQPTRSIETLLVTDLIEHLSKNDGLSLIHEIERTVTKQALIVTPNGFMPQHVSEVDDDEWGFIGNSLQNHISGWEVGDFKGWEVMFSENYYTEMEHPDGVLGCLFSPIVDELKEFHVVIEPFLDDSKMVEIATKLFELFNQHLLNKDKFSTTFTLPLMFSPKSIGIFPHLVLPNSNIQYASFNWDVNNFYEIGAHGQANFVPGTMSNIVKNTFAQHLLIFTEGDESKIRYHEVVDQQHTKIRLDDNFLFDLKIYFESEVNNSAKGFIDFMKGLMLHK